MEESQSAKLLNPVYFFCQHGSKTPGRKQVLPMMQRSRWLCSSKQHNTSFHVLLQYNAHITIYIYTTIVILAALARGSLTDNLKTKLAANLSGEVSQGQKCFLQKVTTKPTANENQTQQARFYAKLLVRQRSPKGSS